eukprot:g24273.t1
MITYVQGRGVDASLISLDQEKAFDRMLHTYMKDVSLRGVTIPGSGSLQVKASPYMDDVAVFCSDPLSVHSLMSISDQFELASGAKVNQGQREAMFFGNWAVRSFIPFTVRTDYLKVLGIRFGGAGACTKSCEDCIAKYIAQLCPVPRKCAVSVTQAIFHFIWRSKIDWVCRDSMYKTLDKLEAGNVPRAALILLATFMCGCIKLCIDP